MSMCSQPSRKVAGTVHSARTGQSHTSRIALKCSPLGQSKSTAPPVSHLQNCPQLPGWYTCTAHGLAGHLLFTHSGHIRFENPAVVDGAVVVVVSPEDVVPDDVVSDGSVPDVVPSDEGEVLSGWSDVDQVSVVDAHSHGGGVGHV